MNNLIKDALLIPVSDPSQTISINPVVLQVENRPIPLELRITAPVIGDKLPVVLLSHGHGPSLYLPSKDGYGPLVNFYAEHGFVVIQPTHLNSKVAGMPADSAGGPLFWRSRVEDMTAILDQLDTIEAAVPAIAGQIDRSRVAVIGHSMGGQTAGLLLGARLTDPNDPDAQNIDMREPRIAAGIMLTAPGNGGASLSEMAASRYSFFNPDFSHLTTRTLVVIGDEDASAHLTVRGPAWHADAFHDSRGADALMTIIGGKHGLGGIAGYDAKETDDEDPERLEIVLRTTWAYLRSALYEGDDAWTVARQALVAHCADHARVELK
ncbi:alpha/beta hydrolase family protein [Mesorhizobium sp. ES1-1]|uniref:alpha/beta hydrolase family protein n=1 Tax=Mesorhizobium sp. ES1-1 TaxID=2876629 RepID=UPI001CD038E7|nr:dienelactone hydrolase [Mesorhizobium sp. ES1-1]MBZ9675648.1 dienelactone hydrolase [Mesorhizobium sp. ES1-1]